MTKYYCDYCDIFLTHDAPRVRKDHNSGWKHALQVRAHYQGINQDKMQRTVAELVKDYQAKGELVPVPAPIMMRPPPGSMPSRPMMGPPGMMSMTGPRPHFMMQQNGHYGNTRPMMGMRPPIAGSMPMAPPRLPTTAPNMQPGMMFPGQFHPNYHHNPHNIHGANAAGMPLPPHGTYPPQSTMQERPFLTGDQNTQGRPSAPSNRHPPSHSSTTPWTRQ